MAIAASALFAVRNAGKCCKQKEYTRGMVSAWQAVNVLDSTAGSTSSIFSSAAKGAGKVLKNTDKAIEHLVSKSKNSEEILKTFDKMQKTTGAASKIGAIAQKVVNPLLCVSSGVRVLKDDDQCARLIEETSAMGAMFGAEAVMKYARSKITGGVQATTGFSGGVANVMKDYKGLNETLTKLKGKFDNLKNLEGGSAKQTIAKLAIDALFVAGSIGAFSLGRKIGTKLSHREPKQEQNQLQNIEKK